MEISQLFYVNEEGSKYVRPGEDRSLNNELPWLQQESSWLSFAPEGLWLRSQASDYLEWYVFSQIRENSVDIHIILPHYFPSCTCALSDPAFWCFQHVITITIMPWMIISMFTGGIYPLCRMLSISCSGAALILRIPLKDGHYCSPWLKKLVCKNIS